MSKRENKRKLHELGGVVGLLPAACCKYLGSRLCEGVSDIVAVAMTESAMLDLQLACNKL